MHYCFLIYYKQVIIFKMNNHICCSLCTGLFDDMKAWSNHLNWHCGPNMCQGQNDVDVYNMQMPVEANYDEEQEEEKYSVMDEKIMITKFLKEVIQVSKHHLLLIMMMKPLQKQDLYMLLTNLIQ